MPSQVLRYSLIVGADEAHFAVDFHHCYTLMEVRSRDLSMRAAQ